jgi:hypothetical protein
MAKSKNPIVFLDVSIGDEPDERMIFEVHFLCFYVYMHVWVVDLRLATLVVCLVFRLL